MLDAGQALAYASEDWSEAHGRFVQLLGERLPGLPQVGRALDLGCGSADITVRVARAFPQWQLDAVDASPAMLALGRRAVTEAGLESRIHLSETRLPAARLPGAAYELILSNSLLHHLADPLDLWRSLRQGSTPGTQFFVMDLLRPESPERVEALVDRYLPNAPAVLRRDFHHSLRAAYREDDVRAQLHETGLAALNFEVVSDRHFIAWGEGRP